MHKMMISGPRRRLIALTCTLAMTLASAALAGGYKVNPLVTDDQAVLATLGYGAAPVTDAALVNPWDFANSGTGPWVIANTGGNGSGIVAGTASVYSGSGQQRSPTINDSAGSRPRAGRHDRTGGSDG